RSRCRSRGAARTLSICRRTVPLARGRCAARARGVWAEGPMLRYVFDTTAQLRRHVHPRDGAALLFFPESSQARRAGESVLLELQLREIGQQVVLRATIHSRVDGNVRGVWLQFGDLLSRTIEADAAALNRRRHPRVGS